MLISVDWLPPYWCPSRRLLRSRLEGRGLITRSKIAPKTGAASPPMARDRDQWSLRRLRGAVGSRGERNRARNRPSERGHVPCDGHHDLVHVLPARPQQPVPLAQPDLSFPRNGPDLRRNLLQPELEMTADLCRIPIGPRAFDERPPRVPVARLGDTPLPPTGPRRVLRRREAEIAHQLPRRVEA